MVEASTQTAEDAATQTDLAPALSSPTLPGPLPGPSLSALSAAGWQPADGCQSAGAGGSHQGEGAPTDSAPDSCQSGT
eukprot:6399143-Prymnesium_polylepis.1